MFAINHAATVLVIQRKYPSVHMLWLLPAVQLMEFPWVIRNARWASADYRHGCGGSNCGDAGIGWNFQPQEAGNDSLNTKLTYYRGAVVGPFPMSRLHDQVAWATDRPPIVRDAPRCTPLSDIRTPLVLLRLELQHRFAGVQVNRRRDVIMHDQPLVIDLA